MESDILGVAEDQVRVVAEPLEDGTHGGNKAPGKDVALNEVHVLQRPFYIVGRAV